MSNPLLAIVVREYLRGGVMKCTEFLASTGKSFPMYYQLEFVRSEHFFEVEYKSHSEYLHTDLVK